MRKVKYYKCPECGKKYNSLGGWSSHMNTMHPGSRPEGFSDSRFFYYTLTGKDAGRCIECHSPTDWSEATGKYNRYCNNPACKKAYVKTAKSRMVNKYGKEYILNDPEVQRKMLASKKMSGYYSFSDGSGKLGYVGTYEKDFLMMMDKFMQYSAKDILSPSPNTYYYDYDGGRHFYIPDFYIPNLNLEVEIKASDNTHPKIQAVDKVKERLKDEVMEKNPKVNYIKINDKSYKGFFEYLINLRESIDDEDLKDPRMADAVAAEALAYMDEIDESVVEGSYDPLVYAMDYLPETLVEEEAASDNGLTGMKPIIFLFESPCGSEYTGLTGKDKLKIINPDKLDTQYWLHPYVVQNPRRIAAKFEPINPGINECTSVAYACFLPAGLHDLFFRYLLMSISSNEFLFENWVEFIEVFSSRPGKKHKYICAGIVNHVLPERQCLKSEDNDNSWEELELSTYRTILNRVMLIDYNPATSVNSEVLIGYLNDLYNETFNINKDKHCIEESVLEEKFYDKMTPAQERAFYNYAFTGDIEPPDEELYEDEPAEEAIQLHTNFNKVKKKGTLSLDKFTKIKITNDILEKYKDKCASFAHCRISNKSTGFLYVDNKDNIVGFVNVVEKQGGVKWIQALNIQPEYQGYSLYEQLLKVAVRDLGGTDIAAPPKNDTAKEVYKQFGFKPYTDESSVCAMSIRADAKRSKYGTRAKPNAGDMEEAGLYPVYIMLTHCKKGFGKFVKFITNAPYSHSSISFDSSMKKLYTFASRDGHTMIPLGFAIESIKTYLKYDKTSKYALYVKLVNKEDYMMMTRTVQNMYNKRTEYRYDVPGTVKAFFGQKNANEKRYFCSGFVAFILNSGKKQVTQKSHDLTLPMDIPDIKNIHLVDMGLVKNYDKKYVDKKVDQIFRKHYMHKEKDSNKQPLED